MSPLLLLISLARADEVALRHHLDEARLFLREGWEDDAAAELEAALALPGGDESYELHWLMARARYAQLDAAAAAAHARRAQALAPGAAEADEAARYAESIELSFGALVIAGPQPGLTSRLQLEPAAPLLDPELRRFVDALALRWTEGVALPLEVALPAGDYLVQGLPVAVRPGAEARLELPMAALGARGFAALQVSRLELSMGVGALLGGDLPELGSSLELQVGTSLPLGPVLLGFTLDGALRGVDVAGVGAQPSPRNLAAGLRLGRELMLDGALAVRPSIGYRYGILSGLALDCAGAPDPAAGPFACAPLGEVPAGDLQVYATGRDHVPYLDLSVDWRRAGRTTATGFGVRVSAERHFVRVPSEGLALVGDRPEPLAWTAAPDWRGAFGLRMMTNLSVAF